MEKQFDNEDDEPMFVTISFEDGTEVEYTVIGIFETDGQDYIAVSDDFEEDKDDYSVEFYYYYEDEEGNPSLESIENEEEYEMVGQIFEQIIESQDDEEE